MKKEINLTQRQCTLLERVLGTEAQLFEEKYPEFYKELMELMEEIRGGSVV